MLLHFSRCQFHCDVVPNVANRDVNEAYPTTYLYIYIYIVLFTHGFYVCIDMYIYVIYAWKERQFHIHTFVWCPCLETQLRDEPFMPEVMQLDRKMVIQELEALAVLTAMVACRDQFENCRAVIFTDSESVRGSFLRAWSRNKECSQVLLSVFKLEESLQAQLWIERVPSQSNPADILSRSEKEQFMEVQRTRRRIHEVWRSAVLARGDGVTERVG